MEGVHLVGGHFVKQAVFHHHAGTTGVHLLRRFKYKHDAAVQLFADGGENLGRTQQRAGVHVVATGVHNTGVLRGKGQPGAFCKGQRVVVGTQPHAIAVRVLPAANHCHHARLADARAGLKSHFPQPLGHESHGAELLLAQLWVLVQVAPPRNHLIPILVR